MDRSKTILFNHPLGDQDRIFEVVAIPGHEGDTHVLPQRQLTHIHRGAISHDIATRNRFPDTHQRTLIDTGILV